jgi:hypothetical protein
MNLFSSILFWAGIVMLTDGSLALLFQEKWQKLAQGLNIQRIALVEIGVAFALLAVHFLLRKGML